MRIDYNTTNIYNFLNVDQEKGESPQPSVHERTEAIDSQSVGSLSQALELYYDNEHINEAASQSSVHGRSDPESVDSDLSDYPFEGEIDDTEIDLRS